MFRSFLFERRLTERTNLGFVRTISIALAFMFASSLLGQTARDGDAAITAVEGESWIRHLHKSFNETSMGKTWELGPAPSGPGDENAPWQLDLSPGYSSQTVTLSGADLYRLNCRGCHGESGQGAPPEINSITGPVQATSVEATMERMKKSGREMSRSEVAEMAKESKIILLQRLHSGGQSMPAPKLDEPEIRSLIAYLELLSGVPGATRNQITVKESPYRVGEHIVKSTCHVCHSAKGPNPDPQQIMEGAIPPLSCLTTRAGLPDFVRKVTAGAPIIMGTPATPYRGRMPVFSYLSHDEAADAYMYLALYPPQK
jgi:mono/diheme cytochrome c family protein